MEWHIQPLFQILVERFETIINTLVKEGSTVITDGWKGYTGISKNYIHKVVEHSTGEYVKDGFHTNSIEGFLVTLENVEY